MNNINNKYFEYMKRGYLTEEEFKLIEDIENNIYFVNCYIEEYGQKKLTEKQIFKIKAFLNMLKTVISFVDDWEAYKNDPDKNYSDQWKFIEQPTKEELKYLAKINTYKKILKELAKFNNYWILWSGKNHYSAESEKIYFLSVSEYFGALAKFNEIPEIGERWIAY